MTVLPQKRPYIQISLTLVPSDPTIDPLAAKGYAVTLDFFRMLDVPFRFGAAWSRASDQEGTNEVVIGDDLNRKIFHGTNSSIGREITFNGHIYRVAGVLKPWNPLPRFMPLATIEPLIATRRRYSCHFDSR